MKFNAIFFNQSIRAPHHIFETIHVENKKKIIFLYYITGLNVRGKWLSEEKNLKIKNKLVIYIYESIRVMFFDRHQQLALDLF